MDSDAEIRKRGEAGGGRIRKRFPRNYRRVRLRFRRGERGGRKTEIAGGGEGAKSRGAAGGGGMEDGGSVPERASAPEPGAAGWIMLRRASPAVGVRVSSVRQPRAIPFHPRQPAVAMGGANEGGATCGAGPGSRSPLAPLLPFPPARRNTAPAMGGANEGAIQPLPWAVRMKVALHAARGLAYLHEEADRQIIYRDFKASNILLDEDFNAQLSDFGLAKDGPEGNQTHVSTRVMGTYGYAAPEYMMTGHLTAKSDVYSFGVVLLEMISGRRAMEPEFPRRQQNIVEWARPFLVDPTKMLLLVDPRVGGEYSVKGAQRAAVLARKCLNKDPHARPLMSEAVRVLSSIQSLTDFASKLEQAQRLHGA
ncbi:unnamed protein product [Closterium sp. Yama58-4]|nr:unnamed protein product [Closterium sp. Yama58-4]